MKTKLLFSALFSTLLLCSTFQNVQAQSFNRPCGIYSIDLLDTSAFVDGVLYRLRWPDLEPAQGVYDFSTLSANISAAYAANKKVTLLIGTGGIPVWMTSLVTTFTHSVFGLTSVPWDTFMLTRLEMLADTVANLIVSGFPLATHPAIAQVNASIGGTSSIRFQSALSVAGYSRENYTYGVMRSVAAWASRFPTKFLHVGLFPQVSDGMGTFGDPLNPTTAEYLRDTILDIYNATTPPMIGFFQENWTGATPGGAFSDILTDVNAQTFIMLQACGEWTHQSAWTQCNWAVSDSVGLGFSYAIPNIQSYYFEMYPEDLDNSAYQSSLTMWHDSLQTLCGNLTGIPLLNVSGQLQVTVYPNPFSSTTTLSVRTPSEQTSEKFKDATLTVYNLFGQQVKEMKNISGQTVTFSRDNLPSGLYFYKLTGNNEIIGTGKLIITDN